MTDRLYDNTRISTFKACPRKFYFRHVLDWTEAGPARAPLIFGGAWHAAMDSLWPNMIQGNYGYQAVAEAHSAFVAEWIERGGPDPEDIDYEMEKEMSPRTPARALDLLLGYAEARGQHLERGFELLHIERPFVVPLDPNDKGLYYVGKIDKICKVRRKIIPIEHKTTTAYSKSGSFRSIFLDSFSPNSQVDGYLFAMHMLFPNKIGGVWVDATLVHKEHEAFQFIPVERQLRMLDTWLWETRDWIDSIEANMAALDQVSPDDKYMAAFPKNTNSCFDFNSACPYLYPCKAWSNPMGRDVPRDLKVEKWDPLDRMDKDTVMKNIEDLKKS